MLAFTSIDRVNASKRGVMERIKDFNEVYNIFDDLKAKEQANRCINCGDPYCHNKCPLHNIIPAWLKQVSEDNLELAFNISNETSPFPEILGRICPHDKLCEGDCTLNDTHGAITIGSVETYISEIGFEQGLKPKFTQNKIDKKVAIVGSGPAGISCATFLARNGVSVDVYERANRAGGLLTYGIPGFKLDKKVVERRVELLKEAGVNFILNCEIGRDKDFEQLLNSYDAIFLAIGATKGKKAGIKGENEFNNTFLAMEFLTGIQKKLFGESDDFIDVKDKNVVVIGGGDTAMDCVRTATRMGAKSVKCLYRRDENSMPGSRKEVVNAKEEGVEFIFNVTPVEVTKNGIFMEKTRLSEPDDNGRRKIEIVPDSKYLQIADIVIYALGFEQELPNFIKELNLELDRWSGIKVNQKYQTSNNKIFAGGDSVRGADLAVTAAYDGREAAKHIVQFLR